MKLSTFLAHGERGFGIITDDGGVIDIQRRSHGRFSDLRSLLAADAPVAVQPFLDGTTDHELADISLLPPVPNPAKILCVGINYETHRVETERPKMDYPVIFTRFADTQVGHAGALVRPILSRAFDYEGELAVIIGRAGRHVKEADALSHVAGYACYNDGSVRDWQRHTSQFTPGKNFPATGAFGPWLVTSDDIPDPSQLTLTTRVNGDILQHAPTSDLIFSVPKLIAYITAFTELHAGDVIVSGTPGGVGFTRTPPIFMKAGDIVEVEISGIGILRNPVVDEAADNRE